MDRTTLRAYATHASELSRRYRALPAGDGIARHLARAFEPAHRVLDIGAGSGRDLAQLVAEGHVAYGIEPVREMRAEAIAAYPTLDGKLLDGALPDALPDVANLGGPFDGVLCSAVLQHLPRAQIFDAVYAIRGVLRQGGRALVSVPAQRPDIGEDGRDAYGRLFQIVPPGELALLFERVGFRVVERWEDPDSLGRADTRWSTFLFERLGDADAGSARPLDRIEAVLRRDRKVATYKFALLRALADIATNSPRQVRWRSDGSVAVPLSAIAEQWIVYYWQLFDSPTFLPQMNGEAGESRHKLGFATELDALRERYAQIGGLPAFLVDWHGGRLTGSSTREAAQELRRLIRETCTAIRTGPVYYAGRSTGGVSTFGFDTKTQDVLVDEALWREIALMAHWIRDSLLVRWAELTARLAEADPRMASREDVLKQALAVLLTPPAPERDTQLARRIFASAPRDELRCVWSGRRLDARFDVDHAIPFALWRRNDLWNLLPTAPSVNLQKRDRLPDRALLRNRKSAIVDSWGRLRDACPQRFTAELGRLAGDSGENLDSGFEAFCEAVEVTALQRSCERWTPRC